MPSLLTFDMGKVIDITGQRFGRLVAVELVDTPRGKEWLCNCDCGNTHTARSNHLRKGAIKSCKCLAHELTSARRSTHQMTGTPTYIAWGSMKTRCLNSNHKYWDLYGGRGIKLCKEWESFDQFFADMGERPDGLTIERIDVDGHYCPKNCCWATPKEQANNRRSSCFIEHDEKRQTMQQWSEELGIPQTTLWNRLNTLGWTVERALGKL